MPTLLPDPKVKMLKERVPPPRAWHGPDLTDDDFRIALGQDCMAELNSIVAEQRRAPVPTLVLQPEHFALRACRQFMKRVKQRHSGSASGRSVEPSGGH
jgi:hypothetical protein